MNKLINYKKIFITGGAGFIGGALIRELINNTEATLYNFDKMGYASSLISINKTISEIGEDAFDRHIFLNGDLSKKEQIDKAIKIAKPDLIFNLAAESHVDRSINSPYQFIDSNIIGTFNLLECLRSYWDDLSNEEKNNFRIIHISTDEVFGSLPSEGSFTEDSPYDPRSPYAASKASSDHLMKAWQNTYGLPIIITNCSNNYGPWQYPEKLIPVIINKALNEKPIPIYGDGLNVRDWLYVEDHIMALIKVAEKGSLGQSYCIGGNSEITNVEIAKNICRLIDMKSPKSFPHSDLITFVKDRMGHDKRYSINAMKIKKELNWEPSISIEQGLDNTVNWYLENKYWFKEN
jgi:dTDP-glucose 4,6-dehydratase